jgi:hypothetical protein
MQPLLSSLVRPSHLPRLFAFHSTHLTHSRPHAESNETDKHSCSLACSVAHKDTHPVVELEAPQPPSAPAVETPSKGVPRAGTLAGSHVKSPFACLDTSEDLRALFKLYPGLAAHLEQIHTAMQPPSPAAAAQNRFSSNSHRGYGGRGKGPWTAERGLENGQKALDVARNAFGKDGEGVREYCELVLDLISRGEGLDAASLIQKQLEEENAQIIKQLLDGMI